jgi:hypothetical protein
MAGKRDGFHVSFEECDALVAQYLNEAKYDRHAAGSVVAKVMAERIRRMKLRSAKATDPR